MASTALMLKIGADIKSLQGDLNKATGLMNGFKSQMGAIGGAIGAAFTVGAVTSFVWEVSKLAAEAEGVRVAFNKLEMSEKLMQDLKTATRGTASELTLMKRAVDFSNFNLNVKELPGLLEFAALRAQQTGKSIDYLVDSMVTGLGRQSVLIMDNLGISSSMLAKEVVKVGDFVTAAGNIVEREMGKMGDFVETNILKTDRLSASWENFKIALGDASNGTGILGQATDSLSRTLDILASKNLTFLEKMAALRDPAVFAAMQAKDAALQVKKLADEQKKHAQIMREVDKYYVEFNKDINAYAKTISTHIYKTELLAEFQKRLNKENEIAEGKIENIKNLTDQLNSKKELQQVLTGKELAQTNQEIKALEEKIKKLRELGTVEAAQRITPANLNAPAVLPTLDTTSMTNIDGLTQKLSALIVPLDAAKQKMMSFGEAWAQVGMAGIDATAAINMSLADMAMGIGEAIGNIASGIGGFEQIGGALLSGIAGMMNQLGQLAIGAGIAVDGIKKH